MQKSVETVEMSFNSKKVKVAKKAIELIDWLCAVQALRRYKYFLMHGGKRPFVHDDQGRIIAPVCAELVPMLEHKGARLEIISTTWPRQELRSKRHEQHAFNKRANEAYAEHEAEAKDAEFDQLFPETAKQIEDDIVDLMQGAVDHFIELHGQEEVLTKRFAKRTTVIMFTQGREVEKPKHREVFELNDDGTIRTLTASVGNRKAVAELEQSGFKWGKLIDHEKLVRHLAEMRITTIGTSVDTKAAA